MKQVLLSLGIMLLFVSCSSAQPDVSWFRTFGGNALDECRAMLVTDNGDILLVGTTYSFGAGGADAYVIRINIEGDTIWTRTFGTDSTESFWDIVVTPEGYYYAASLQFAACFDDNGDTLWTRPVVGPGWSTCTNMKITDDGGCLFSNYGATIVRYDSSGQELWTRSYDPDGCVFGLLAASNGVTIGTG